MDVDLVLYQPCPSTLVHPSSLAPQVPRCNGSSVQPGSKCHQDDLSSSPEQSKELTLCQRLGPPVDIQASWPSWGGSLISWMTEQPPHMSHSSAHPGPPLLLLLPPQSHIPTHPHLPHPYLPSCHRLHLHVDILTTHHHPPLARLVPALLCLSPCRPHCSPSPGHGLSHHAPSHGQHSPHSYLPLPLNQCLLYPMNHLACNLHLLGGESGQWWN